MGTISLLNNFTPEAPGHLTLIYFYLFTLYHVPSFVHKLELHLPGFAFAFVFYFPFLFLFFAFEYFKCRSYAEL